MQWRNLRGIGGLKTGKDQDDKPTGELSFAPYTLPDLSLFQNRPLAVNARARTIMALFFSVFQASIVGQGNAFIAVVKTAELCDPDNPSSGGYKPRNRALLAKR